MHHFHYQNNELYCEGVPVEAIAAKVGTPFYLYSSATLSHHYRVFDGAFEGFPTWSASRSRPTATWPF